MSLWALVFSRITGIVFIPFGPTQTERFILRKRKEKIISVIVQSCLILIYNEKKYSLDFETAAVWNLSLHVEFTFSLNLVK